MRHDARVDANHLEIAQAYRSLGWKVKHTHKQGEGFPDLVVAKGVIRLVEIKDGKKSPSRRKLTPAQIEFHKEWEDYIDIITSVQEVLDANEFWMNCNLK